MSLPPFPLGWEWLEGVSSNGEIYLVSRGTPNVDLEVAIFGARLGADRWRLIERPSRIILGRKRMKEIREELRRGAKIEDLVPELSTDKDWGRF